MTAQILQASWKSGLMKAGKEVVDTKIPTEIVTYATEMLEHFGSCPAFVCVIGSKRKIIVPLELGNTNAQRVDDMTMAGADLARSAEDLGDIQFLVYACEAWASPPRERMVVMPSQDPNRQEVLLINGLEPTQNKQSMLMFAIKRDYKDKVLEIQPLSQMAESAEVKGNLLPAFLSGYRLFRR